MSHVDLATFPEFNPHPIVEADYAKAVSKIKKDEQALVLIYRNGSSV